MSEEVGNIRSLTQVVIVVGLDPGRNPGGPLDPGYPSGRRLAGLTGLDPRAWAGRTPRVNLHPVPGAPPAADAAAARNLRGILGGSRVVALGGRVAAALGVGGVWFQWRVAPGAGGYPGFVGAGSPHPSGLSRWWNDPAHRRSAAAFWRGAYAPCVHLEGVDGSGKSTLAPALARALECRVVPTDGPPGSWAECLARVDRRVAPGLVADRSSGLVSELVYGPVLRGGCLAPEADLWALAACLARCVTWVYCRPPRDALAPRTRPGEDPAHEAAVRADLNRLSARYDEVADRLAALGGRVVRYDWTRDSVEGVARCVA